MSTCDVLSNFFHLRWALPLNQSNIFVTKLTILHYKTVNLVVRQKLLNDQREMLSVIGKSYIIYHILTLRIFGAPKKLHFWQNCEQVLNQLNFAS